MKVNSINNIISKNKCEPNWEPINKKIPLQKTAQNQAQCTNKNKLNLYA